MLNQWTTWRQEKNVDIDQFTAWLDTYTAEENDQDNLFAFWRQTPDRNQMLKNSLRGQIVALGRGPQFLLACFHALYRVLQGKRCFIASTLPLDAIYAKAVLQKLTALGQLKVRIMGTQLGCSKFYLGDCSDVDLALVDYFQLMAVYRNKPELFGRIVNALFLLEADTILYTARLIIMNNGTEKAAGMIYKSSGKTPAFMEDKATHLDCPRELDTIDELELAGSTSYLDKYTVNELKTLMPRKLAAKIAPRAITKYTAFTYRTSQKRTSALVSDVIKTPGNALVVCNSDELRAEISEEFRKSGQESTVTSRSTDISTFFTTSESQENQKKVCIMKGLPSPLVATELKHHPGAVYIAEHFISMDMHQKIFAVGEQLFTPTHEPRLYFSLEDQLFTLYAERGGFARLFDLIDFTEKYDPWKQIRRVLAKSMAAKLHRLRTHSLDETAPLITVILGNIMQQAPKKTRKVTSKLDAPCFCGSGKPFRECHGKLMK